MTHAAGNMYAPGAWNGTSAGPPEHSGAGAAPPAAALGAAFRPQLHINTVPWQQAQWDQQVAAASWWSHASTEKPTTPVPRQQQPPVRTHKGATARGVKRKGPSADDRAAAPASTSCAYRYEPVTPTVEQQRQQQQQQQQQQQLAQFGRSWGTQQLIQTQSCPASSAQQSHAGEAGHAMDFSTSTEEDAQHPPLGFGGAAELTTSAGPPVFATAAGPPILTGAGLLFSNSGAGQPQAGGGGGGGGGFLARQVSAP